MVLVFADSIDVSGDDKDSEGFANLRRGNRHAIFFLGEECFHIGDDRRNFRCADLFLLNRARNFTQNLRRCFDNTSHEMHYDTFSEKLKDVLFRHHTHQKVCWQ
jgi:hypothetical protein